jgi:hypothetical protein
MPKDPFRTADKALKCPQCGQAFCWNKEDGLTGQTCSFCNYTFKASDSRRKICKITNEN